MLTQVFSDGGVIRQLLLRGQQRFDVVRHSKGVKHELSFDRHIGLFLQFSEHVEGRIYAPPGSSGVRYF